MLVSTSKSWQILSTNCSTSKGFWRKSSAPLARRSSILSCSTMPEMQMIFTSSMVASLRTRPWWIYLAGFAFAAAFVEWWTWLRRITV